MRRDNAYLEDIRLACEDINDFIAGRSLQEFLDNEMMQAAVEYKIMVVGEAAGRISEELRSSHPQVPWRRVIQLRNFYIHGYERLSPEQVWGTARRLIPRVWRLVLPLIPDDEDEVE